MTRADAPDPRHRPGEAGAGRGSSTALPEPEPGARAPHQLAAATTRTYTLRLVDSPGALAPPAGHRPRCSRRSTSPSRSSARPTSTARPRHDCPPSPPEPPRLSYLAKDYRSFRRLMLGRMAQIMPEWRERSPADLGITLVEVLAYTADRLSYAQDAVGDRGLSRHRAPPRPRSAATPGSSTTACTTAPTPASGSQLGSTRRHGRSRPADDAVPDPRSPALDPRSPTPTAERDRLAPAARWSSSRCTSKTLFSEPQRHRRSTTGAAASAACPRAPRGRRSPATSPNLAAGDVLVFEERLGPRTGRAADADPGIRHAVRLTAVRERPRPTS